MTPEEILKMAIEKARQNGCSEIPEYSNSATFISDFIYRRGWFSHDFLKAFYGEEEFVTPNYEKMPNWQYHGCQMLLSEDPIQYLAKYI